MHLLPHQSAALALALERKHLFLALPAGSGKTLLTLAIAQASASARVLIIAPAPLLHVWSQEHARFPHLLASRPVLVRGTPAKRAKLYEEAHHARAFTLVVSYETARADIAQLSRLSFDLIALDESGKIRNPTAKTTKALMKLSAPCKLCLDGNPISNTIADLFAPCTWLDSACLGGNWWKFRAQYAVMSPYIQGKIDSWRNVEEIQNRVKHLLYWRKKEEILPDLPEKVEMIIPVELSAPERSFYKKIEEEFLLEIQNQETQLIENALVKLMRLRQATYGSTCFEPDSPACSKYEAMKELLSSFPKGERVVIFSQFEQVVSSFSSRLAEETGYQILTITGQVDAVKREKALADFEKDPAELTVLFGTSAIERGLNLQKASYMIHLDLPWSFASYDQRIGRIWRQGQKKPSMIYTLQAMKSVDIHMQKILDKKISLSDSVSSHLMSKKELAELFTEPF